MARMVAPFSDRSLEEWTVVLQQAASPDERYRALLAVKSLGSVEEVVASSRRSMNDDDSAMRALAAKQLGELKELDSTHAALWDDIATELISRLSDSDVDVRFEAARALGRVHNSNVSARNVLLALLEEEETQPLMLASVVTALAARSDVDLAALAARYGTLLSHEQAEVREAVSAAVAVWGLPAAALIDPLLLALDDEEPLVRENAALALGRAGVASEAVAAALRTAATDEDEVAASVARDALLQLGLTHG